MSDIPPEGKMVVGDLVKIVEHPGKDASDADREDWAVQMSDALLDIAKQLHVQTKAPVRDMSLALIIASGKLAGALARQEACCTAHVLNDLDKDRMNFDHALTKGFEDQCAEDDNNEDNDHQGHQHASTH